nr:LD-carboxypeptidase [Acinetobacter sp. Marseille-Q1620]
MHIQIVSPSACVDVDKIQLAKKLLEQLGHQVSLAEHVFDQYRYLAGTVEDRVEDLKLAFLDESVDLIWCGRGGTGAAQLLPFLDNWILNKPIIGYSDSTILLNKIAQKGGQAIHGPVFQEIASKNLEGTPLSTDALEVLCLLSDKNTNHYAICPVNSAALACQDIKNAKILGGNLTTLSSIQGTPYSLELNTPTILMLEDVGEPYYRIERSLVQLLQSIDTSKLGAVILGDFYQCPQKNVPHSLNQIFSEYLDLLDIPLYECQWFGHGEHNRPFWVGKPASIIESQLII